ncbi:hypothetical protein QJS04_geneDACA021249 [Acorus gramineus]|uniref:Protein JASON-like n=1 Tax=Acorus gramineus TaxID=55184 RepID=A0AAV9BW34_ACOGR|nr:hypothetical protein QJS04_geneDACA021249 [Acorus gramineus]
MKNKVFLIDRDFLSFFVPLSPFFSGILDSFMGCFFGCFRFKDRNGVHRGKLSEDIASKERDVIPSDNQLGSFFLREDCSGDAGEADIELRKQAKFLMSCGALLETPEELREASEKIVLSRNGTGSSLKELQLDKLPPPLPAHSDSQLHESGGCMSEEPQNSAEVDRSHSPGNCPAMHNTEKCVRFEYTNAKNDYQSDMIPSRISPSEADRQIRQPQLKQSPFPTPLKLTDQMQTPGTVNSTNMEGIATARNTRILTPYVYPVLKPVLNTSQWKALSERVDSSQQSEDMSPEYARPVKEMNLDDSIPATPTTAHGITHSDNGEQIQHKSMAVEASLSQWLRPVTANDERNHNNKPFSRENSRSSKSPQGDRPIIGTVFAHWSDKEPSPISPKEWDGNGIPNSTNKYKEDQKVSWHATPFEVRLEKALSDEKLFPTRKPIEFDESEETDTAASFPSSQPIPHLKHT